MENTKIEDILNKIYAQPDLKGGVFNFINPIILKANKYLQENKLDIEQKYALENLLFKEIPQLVDTYTKLPINYRNEKKVKAGKTHREMLISNFELLGQNFLKIEGDIYAAVDMEAAVQTRVIQTKYQTPVLLEVDYDYQKVEDDFQWDSVKDQYKETLPEEVMNKIFVKEEKKVEKVKEPAKPKEPAMTSAEIESAVGAVFKLGFWGTILYFVVMFFYHQAVDNNRAEELAQIGTIINVGKSKSSDKAIESNLSKDSTLLVIKNYSKDNKITLQQTADKILVTNKQTQRECKESLNPSNFYSTDLQSMTINGMIFKELQQTYKMTSEMIEATCNLSEDNIVTAAYTF